MNVAAIGSVLAGVSIRTPSSSEGISATLNDFGKLLEGTGTYAIKTLETAETQSLRALSGDGSTRQVVEAVMSAEQTLQIAVGIRDKIVSAYLELSRMAI
jgi:flagellar hook-basal body complex protein FliE